ncbi:hypothetical protein I315_02420 [Cryptococcus gattii Ru294]|nr:hypothetical protein I315_02420 [Cryptococcus gattii Ru294]
MISCPMKWGYSEHSMLSRGQYSIELYVKSNRLLTLTSGAYIDMVSYWHLWNMSKSMG